jgi:hypothetical protein
MRVKWETPEAQALSDKLDRWIADERRSKRRPRETEGELFGLVLPSLEGVGPGGERSVR